MWSSKYLSSLGEAFFTYSILMIQQASNERWFFCFPLGWQGTMEQAFVCTYVGCMHAKSLQSCLILCDLWMVACQVPLSMGFSRQEYWSGLPCPPPGESSQPRTRTCISCLLYWQAGSLPLVPPGKSPFDLKTFISLMKELFKKQNKQLEFRGVKLNKGMK